MKTALAVLALALVALVPTAQAQGDVTGIALTSTTGAGTVPYMGTGTLGVQGEVGCAHILQNQPGAAIEIMALDPPSWLTVTPDETEAEAAGCLSGQGRSSFVGTVEVAVSADAPAVVQHVIQLVASIGDEASDPMGATLTVAYNSNYSVVPSLTFPYTLTAESLNDQGALAFTATGTQASNAPSMIMVDGFSACDGASVSGFGALQYNNDGGKPDTKTYNIVFTPPAAEWTSCAITLRVYGHYNFPDGSAAGEPTDRKTITWEVTNGGLKPAGGGGGGKDSPAPVAMVIGLGLLGLAALRRRQE